MMRDIVVFRKESSDRLSTKTCLVEPLRHPVRESPAFATLSRHKLYKSNQCFLSFRHMIIKKK